MATDSRAAIRRAERALLKQARIPNPPTGKPNRKERLAAYSAARKEEKRNARTRG
jgi:hypothetical protein